ncbi:hypothetical protein LguiA_001006 [Lonicera macranthoides]
MRWDGVSSSACMIVNRTGIILAKYRLANEAAKAAVAAPGAAPEAALRCWIKLSIGTLKCNVDASICSDPIGMEYGGVIRDENGQFVVVVQGAFAGHFSPLIAEAVGLREVLTWIKDQGTHLVTIEFDGNLLIDALNSDDDIMSSVCIFVNDCKALVRAIYHCSVSFIYRLANSITHSIVRVAGSELGRTV